MESKIDPEVTTTFNEAKHCAVGVQVPNFCVQR